MFACIYIYGMHGIVDAYSNDIFQEINENGFFKDPLLKSFPYISGGRWILLKMRYGEITRENTFNNVARRQNMSDNMHIVASSFLYDKSYFSATYTSDRPIREHNPQDLLRIFVSGIGALEDALIDFGGGIDKIDRDLLRKTRVRDLFILSKMLECDNHKWIQEAHPQTLPELLGYTHTKWPPSNCMDVHPWSAYSVVKAALFTRMLSNTDAVVDTGTYE